MKAQYTIAALLMVTGLTASAQEPAGVFQQPVVMAQYGRQQAQASALLKKGEVAAAQKLCEASIKLAPQYPGAHYNLACSLAIQGKKDEAFASLTKAIACGLSEADHIQKDDDLKSLREDERFARAIAAAKTAKPLLLWPANVEKAVPKEGEVFVSEKNTAFDIRFGFFVCFLEKSPAPKDKPLVNHFGEAGKLLNQWYKDGTAAGNVGDFYDNHDEEHSNMSYQNFPQLTRIEFTKEVKELKPGMSLHRGLQTQIFYNDCVVLGNASVALVSRPYWRSMTRMAYTDNRFIQVLANQYTNNHLYMYPEHRDHDVGHNGKGEGKEEGYGDVFPANTPYVITSQGSSGTDRVFLDAVGCTLAAFRPEVKQKLVKERALMPTVQMIFRSSNKNIKNVEDYLTGKAHPSVFEGNNLDVKRMVTAAHDLKVEDLPPLVALKVVGEDKPRHGIDYMDVDARGERLFETPSAIARVMRSTAHTRKMEISAEDSRDINKKALKYHWVILRGDPKRITINPLNKEGSRAEIVVAWQERQPIEPGSKMESNRVDIGVFVHNGTHYSAPAFVTFYGLDNQKRTYDDKNRILVVDYADKDMGKNYVDPLVDLKKTWRDEYHYDSEGRLLGWTRQHEKAKEEFTAQGALVEKKDAKGRPLVARTVSYGGKQPGGNQAPILEQLPGNERFHYEYASEEDRLGKVARREKAE